MSQPMRQPVGLADYLAFEIVSQHEHRVEVHRRDDQTPWVAEAFSKGEALEVPDSDPLQLDDVYAGTELA